MEYVSLTMPGANRVERFLEKTCSSVRPSSNVFIRCFFILVFINLLFGLTADKVLCSPPAPGQDKPALRVGVFNYYPLVYEKDGVPTGFQLELLKNVAQKEGWTVKFIFSGSMKNVVFGLENNSINLGLALIPTSSRSENLLFTTEKNALVQGQVFVRSDRSDIQTMNDLNQKVFGYVREDALAENFIEISNKMGISPVFRQTNSYDDLIAALIAGDLDAGMFNHLQGTEYCKLFSAISPSPIIFKPVEVQYAVAKEGGDTFFITALDKHLRSLKMEEGSAYYQLKNKFLTDSAALNDQPSGREILISLCICLLVIILGILVGVSMINKMENNNVPHSRPYIRDIIIFTVIITLFYWFFDALVLWLVFNDQNHLTLLELTVTNIPRENMYIRGMFFIMSCFFSLFLIQYISRYEKMFHLLMVSVHRFEQLTENAQDMIFHMSLPNGQYDFVNKASARIFGYPPEEFYKKPLLVQELIHPNWQKFFHSYWLNVLAGKIPASCEYEIITKAGEVRRLNQRSTLYFDDSGVPNALEGIITDVTESKGTAEAA